MKLKTKIVTSVLTLLMSMSVAASPALAADMNKDEQRAYDAFVAVLDGFEARTNFDHAGQYKAEGKRALLDSRIDLDSKAADEFCSAIDRIDGILAECDTQGEAWQRRGEIIPAVNRVANRHGMEVSVDQKTHDAKVTIKGDIIASTGKVVRQTGFSVGQSVAIAAMAGVSLVIAFALTRRGDPRRRAVTHSDSTSEH